MRTGRPHAAVWLDIPRSCHLRASFTGDWDIQVMFGQPDDEVNMIFDRSALARLVEIASELLAVPVPDDPDVEVSEIRSPGVVDRVGADQA